MSSIRVIDPHRHEAAHPVPPDIFLSRPAKTRTPLDSPLRKHSPVDRESVRTFPRRPKNDVRMHSPLRGTNAPTSPAGSLECMEREFECFRSGRFGPSAQFVVREAPGLLADRIKPNHAKIENYGLHFQFPSRSEFAHPPPQQTRQRSGRAESAEAFHEILPPSY